MNSLQSMSSMFYNQEESQSNEYALPPVPQDVMPSIIQETVDQDDDNNQLTAQHDHHDSFFSSQFPQESSDISSSYMALMSTPRPTTDETPMLPPVTPITPSYAAKHEPSHKSFVNQFKPYIHEPMAPAPSSTGYASLTGLGISFNQPPLGPMHVTSPTNGFFGAKPGANLFMNRTPEQMPLNPLMLNTNVGGYSDPSGLLHTASPIHQNRYSSELHSAIGDHNFSNTTFPRTYTCSFPSCGDVFSSSRDLRDHLQSHNVSFTTNTTSKGKSFTCTSCGSSFRRLPDLQRHYRSIHSEAKPFICPQGCGKSFSRKDALKRHLNAKTSSICAGHRR